MMVYIGSDHRGFEYKQRLIEDLSRAGYQVEDLGNAQYDQHDDYPEFAGKVGRAVASASDGSLGILLCGSGVGVAVAANKIKGARAVAGFLSDQVEHARAADNANILAIGAQELDYQAALDLVIVFLKTEFAGEERHLRRLEQIKQMEDHFGETP